MVLQMKYPAEVAKEVAGQEKALRKRRKLTQAQLAARSGVSLPSLKRFEQTGEISFVSLLKIAGVLDETAEFEKLFATHEYGSIEEVIDEANQSGHRKF